MTNRDSRQKRNYVHLGGFAVWIAATLLMMLHNAEATYARAIAGDMAPMRAFVEAALTVLTIEVTGLYFLYAATKVEITPGQRRVAGWGVGLSVALGILINLLGGVEGSGLYLNLIARGAQGVCLALIARWHWVGNQTGESLAEQLAATQQELQETQADLAKVVHQADELVEANARLQAQREAQPEPQLDATVPSRAVVVVAQPKQATTKGKIDPAQLAAGLERGMSAKELAQLFGVSEAGIRKTAVWQSRKVQS